jgi:acetyl esterase
MAADASSDVAIERFSIPCAPSDLSAVRIVPARAKELVGQMLYLHGGGWVFGSIDTHLSPMAHLAARTGLEIIGINYRLAPEFPFPDALNDSLAAWRSLSSTGLGARLRCDLSGAILWGEPGGRTDA